MLHALLGRIKSLVVPAPIDGPPNGPLGFRLSSTRHGVIGTNRVAPVNTGGPEVVPTAGSKTVTLYVKFCGTPEMITLLTVMAYVVSAVGFTGTVTCVVLAPVA